MIRCCFSRQVHLLWLVAAVAAALVAIAIAVTLQANITLSDQSDTENAAITESRRLLDQHQTTSATALFPFLSTFPSPSLSFPSTYQQTFTPYSSCSYSLSSSSDMLISAIKKPLVSLNTAVPILQLENSRSSISNTLRTLNGIKNDNVSAEYESNNRILNHRNIIELKKVSNPLKTVTVSSYNILSRHYVWEQVYSHLPNEYTNWNKRFERLNKSFADLSKLSDIMCFQEMEYQVYRDYWKSYLGNMNYGSVFEKKPKPAYWKKSSNMMDGVSIFYNKEKFELINYEAINFARHFKNSSVIEQTKDTESRLISRNTVAIIAVLKHKFTNETIFVSNTHLYWNPSHDDVRLMQVLLLTNLIKKSAMRILNISEAELNERIENKVGPNIIMAGDFNSSPKSVVYKFMTKGFVNKKDESNFTQNYGPKVSGKIENSLGTFISPYKDLYSRGLYTKTTYSPKFKEVIDYIWYANDNENFKFTKVLGDIDPNYLKKFQGFPNEEFPSDHIPILSQFEFN